MKVQTSPGVVTIELSRRNLTVLLAKLDDPLSARTILKSTDDGTVLAEVRAVEDDAHYADRAPGEMFMPSTGETL